MDLILRSLLSFRGQHPAQETRCLAVGKTDISPPISESTGSDGYFDFIEGYMEREITGNEMNFSIMSSDVLAM